MAEIGFIITTPVESAQLIMYKHVAIIISTNDERENDNLS